MRLPIGAAASFVPAARVTLALRVLILVTVAALGIAAFRAASSTEAGPTEISARGRTTILVLDVSSSIRPRVFRQIDRTLEQAVEEGGRLGVVLFSDTAYELLPPATPSRELDPLRRFFTPRASVPAGIPTVQVGKTRFVVGPWSTALSSGTRISSGLELALEVLDRSRIPNGDVLLVSDLNNEFIDFAAVTRAIERFEARRVSVRVVALSAAKEDERAFRRLLADGRGSVEQAPDPDASLEVADDAGSFPVALGLALIGLLLALAAFERLSARVPLTEGRHA